MQAGSVVALATLAGGSINLRADDISANQQGSQNVIGRPIELERGANQLILSAIQNSSRGRTGGDANSTGSIC